MRRRLIAVMVAMAVVMAGLSARLYMLSQSELKSASMQQSTRRDVMAVARGTIYDRYMQPLVNTSSRVIASVAPYTECVVLMEKRLSGTVRTATLDRLSQGERATVELNGWLSPTVGITQIRAPFRYDAQSLACHVIGYVNEEYEGVCGVEKACDAVLEAYKGEASVSYPIDALGRVGTGGEDVLVNTLGNAVGGVALTIDREIQRIAQQAAAYLERGAVVVLDAKSGDVLASVSMPLYDRNDIEQALGDASSPLLDRTCLNYNLGSVFKVLVAAAALENGMSVDTAYNCAGVVEVSGVRFHCHNPLGDGRQTMWQAVANSCNCYFIQLALDVGASAIYDLAVRAGLSEAIVLMDGYETSCAVLPSRRDLSADAALANLAIGQGDLLVTPYHAASLLQAVANHGVMAEVSLFYGTVNESAVLQKVPASSSAVRLFSPSTAQAIRDMLTCVTENGTGVAARPVHGTAAGKTGTAETGWEMDGEQVVQSWFSGYYPADDPQYVITVLSENGGTNGKTAAPLFADVANGLFEAGLC